MIFASTAFGSAISQSWPPFVLVAGLLLIGALASSDGLFAFVGDRIAAIPGNGFTLFAALMTLVALVTVLLNLDTSIVFLTPIVLHAARRRGINDTAFLYGVIYMSNSASLLLPGSNLTNLLVISDHHIEGTVFASTMVLPWLAAVAITAAIVGLWQRRSLSATGQSVHVKAPFNVGFGLLGVVIAVIAVLTLANPALVVIVAALICATGQIAFRHKIRLEDALKAVNVPSLVALFAFAILAGGIARLWGAPGRLLATSSVWVTSLVGAGLASAINNLPAAVFLSSRTPAHPYALLLGLDLGPNLVITGALSAILWRRIAREERAETSAVVYSKVGVVIVACTLCATAAILQ